MGKSKKKTRLGYNVPKEDINDEVDDFMEQKDKVSLTDENEEGEEEEGEVLGVSLPADDDEEDEAKEDDEEEDDEAKEAKQKAREKGTAGWGKGKQHYYDADTKDYEIESDEEVALDEEREVKRLQAEKAKELQESDFVVPLISQEADKSSQKESDPKTKNKKVKAAYDLLRSDDGGVEVEQVQKDLSGLSKEEKLAIVVADAPELLGLLEQLEQNLKEVKDENDPLLQKIAEKKLPTEKGLSFLDCKQQLLLMYCTHIVFYLLLKAEGKPVKDHPVIKQLVHIRVMLEKMKPIGTKLKYQIDKLLKKNTTAAALGLGTDVTPEELSHRPRPDLLLPKNETGGILTVSKAKKEEAGDEEPKGPKFKAGKSEDGIYRPPKITPQDFDRHEQQIEKKRSMKEKEREKARKNRELDDYRRIILEKPEEENTGGAAAVEQDTREQEIEAAEEEMYTRFMPSKEDKKKRKVAALKKGGFEDMDDFGDIAGLVQQKKQKNEDTLEGLRAEKKKGKGKVKFGNQDIPSDSDDDFFGGMPDVEAFEAYEKAEAVTQKKKNQKKERRGSSAGILLNEADPDLVEPGDRRGASQKIIKNRGLIPHRRKDIKTPRTKQREKFRQAQKRRRSQVQDFSGKQEVYGGEGTGIKKSLTRSRRLK